MKPRQCPICQKTEKVRAMPVKGLATVYFCEGCYRDPMLREEMLLKLIEEIRRYPKDPEGVHKRLAKFVKEHRLIEPVLIPPEE